MNGSTWLAMCVLVAAWVPALLLLNNLRLYRLPITGRTPSSNVSILVPARNEAVSIKPAIETLLASEGLKFEIIVLDDHSTDGTAEQVQSLAARDSRVRLARSSVLPAGWCGKQFACHQLAALARYPTLVFIDADVRLAPDGLSRSVATMESTGVSLLSGFPRQVTDTWLERLLIPLIHFVLLGFLPIARMRRSLSPAYAAGCGQLMITNRAAYERAGGHAAIRASLHDGIRLPQAYRRAGLSTDLFDATNVASCRMYRSTREVWQGLSKNATEGLAHPRVIGPMSVVLLLGQVLPPLLLLWMITGFYPDESVALAGLACMGVVATRVALWWRFRQSILGALLHPLAVVLLLTLQWSALIRLASGRPATWKGRRYPAVIEPRTAPMRSIDS